MVSLSPHKDPPTPPSADCKSRPSIRRKPEPRDAMTHHQEATHWESPGYSFRYDLAKSHPHILLFPLALSDDLSVYFLGLAMIFQNEHSAWQYKGTDSQAAEWPKFEVRDRFTKFSVDCVVQDENRKKKRKSKLDIF
ncbi:hypothetical protein E5288_WYG009117 [Bos mutus]|uniref:Uncharacterized protein n=1 Tax=Bos mutus TaxID=72004 RepID=A0A6B0QT78_9CETA|nr:hypothetical protein [Bos mutus]